MGIQGLHSLWGLNDFDLISLSNLANGSGPEIVKLLLVEPLTALLADSSFELLLVNGWGIRLVAFLIHEVATLKLGAAITKLLDGPVRHGLDSTSLLTIGLAGRGEWHETS